MKKVPRSKRLRYLHLLDVVERPLIPPAAFDLSSYTEANAELEFRFDVAGVRQLFAALRIPEVVVTDKRDRVLGIDALCIMLRRFAYPTQYYELMERFGHSREALSRIFLHMVDYVHDTFSDAIYFAESLVRNRIQDYCDVIHAKSAPAECIFGFVDGTKIAVCRPSPRPGTSGESLQKHCYSGHARHHCLIYQAVTAPDDV